MFAPLVAKTKTQTKESGSSSNKQTQKRPAQEFAGRTVEQILFLQRTIGNQATGRLLSRQTARDRAVPAQAESPLPVSPLPGVLQAKLEVGAVDDPLEREADRVAEHVMRMPDPAAQASPTASHSAPEHKAGSPTLSGSTSAVQRKCSCGGSCDKCKSEQADDEQGKVQRKSAAPQISRVASSPSPTGMTAPPIVHEVLRSPGQPLDPATRAFMEPRFGRDFGKVRVHTDAKAAESARAVNALAYTVEDHIAFGAGQHAPDSETGRKLIAHELIHTLQHGEAPRTEDGQLLARPIDVTRRPVAGTTALFRQQGGCHSEYEPSAGFGRRGRLPHDDEQQVNWNDFVVSRPPKDPFVVLPVLPSAEYPHLPWQPLPPGKGCPTHHTKEGLNPGRSSVGEGIKEDLRLAERSNAWHAYREAARPVQAMQEAVAPDINLFFHAEKNQDLKALGFTIYPGNLLDLSSRQQLPHRGGPQLESLFRGGGELNITKADEKAIRSSAAALQQGKGTVEDDLLATQQEDSNLTAALDELKAAAQAVAEANENLNAAVAAIEYAEAQKQGEEAQAEIEELKKQTESIKSVIEFAIKWPTMIAETVEGKPGEMLGTLASTVLDFVSAEKLKRLEENLQAAKQTMKKKKAEELQHKLESAKAGVLKEVKSLSGKRDRLRSAMTARRRAYNTAGRSAGAVAGGSRNSQQKVAAMIAAIPIVENAVAALQNIGDKTKNARPRYSPEAGLGYGIALYHKEKAAFNLPVAIGVLEWCNAFFGETYQDWSERLKSLRDVKEQIAGTRPGPDPAQGPPAPEP